MCACACACVSVGRPVRCNCFVLRDAYNSRLKPERKVVGVLVHTVGLTDQFLLRPGLEGSISVS